LVVLINISCKQRNDMEPEIQFETTAGTIVVRLYPETPKHRDNFVKLVESGYYNGILFHRVIKDFMIQAGDPDSKQAKKNQFLGSGDVKYTIPAEIIYPKYYHKKGALAAARQGDDENPERASSGGQFYIVKGHKFNDKQLDSLEFVRKKKLEKKLIEKYTKSMKEMFTTLKEAKNNARIQQITDSIQQLVQTYISKNPTYKFNAEQRKTYKTIGGTPHLDGEYTVFGEVIEGLNIVSDISKVKTDKNDRPKRNIRILQAKRIK
jgi:cyclophilin family peptidyl-prolyl cis-trans isomerase